jgi:hypothetical protein
MHDSGSPYALASSIGFLALEGALHLSGYHNVPLAITLLAGAVLSFLYIPYMSLTEGWSLEWEQPFQFHRRLIPLSLAVDIALRKLYATFAKAAAKGLADNPRTWMAYCLTAEVTYPVFGKEDQWSPLAPISTSEFKGCRFSDDSSSITRWGEKSPRYTDISIRRRDLFRRIAEMRGWDNTR